MTLPEGGSVPPRSTRWPLALLLLALSTTFFFSHERGQFYRSGAHDRVSAEQFANALSLSPAHGFRLFNHRMPSANGDIIYSSYNSFPMGGYILIKLVTLPFENLSSQIHAARVLMLLFSAATALLAYGAVRRLTANPWIALATTLFAFASPYCLYYNDLIATETLAFFSVALAFHGMTIFVLEGRFGQLVAKTCVALLLGWYVFALLLPFTLLGLLRVVFGERGEWSNRWRRLVRSHYLRLGIVAVLFGLGMLALNLANEYRGHYDEPSVERLRTYTSALNRMGLSKDFNAMYAEQLSLQASIGRSLYHVGRMAGPYAMFGYTQNLGEFPARKESPAARVVGLIVVAVGLVGLLFVRHRVLLAAAALCGMVWGILMRGDAAFHGYVAQLHLGLWVFFFALVLLWVRRTVGDRVIPAVALFAVACFVQSSWSMSEVGKDKEASKRGRQLLADFDLIRNVTGDTSVSIGRGAGSDKWHRALRFYLHGRNVIGPYRNNPYHLADFTVLRSRLGVPGLLTPGNSVAFLYYTQQLNAFVQEVVKGGRQVLEHVDFDVYFHEQERMLIYVYRKIWSMRVLLHVVPAVSTSLPAERRQHGFVDLTFMLQGHVQLDDQRWAQVVMLPSWPVRSITTGPLTTGDEAELWRHSFGLGQG